MDLTKQFFKYVSQNIFGLLGTSCYILADTYFIAQAAGTDGVTLLNLCLPIYNFIFAIGSMIGAGLGHPLRHCQGAGRRCPGAAVFFQRHPVRLCWRPSRGCWRVPLCPAALLRLMGGDAGIVTLGIPVRPHLSCCSRPFFMCNYIVSAFVRNDGDPSLAMVATLSGSLFNVVFDYIFMFPLGLGLGRCGAGHGGVTHHQHLHLQPPFSLKRKTPCNSCGRRPSARLLGAELSAGHLRLCG